MKLKTGYNFLHQSLVFCLSYLFLHFQKPSNMSNLWEDIICSSIFASNFFVSCLIFNVVLNFPLSLVVTVLWTNSLRWIICPRPKVLHVVSLLMDIFAAWNFRTIISCWGENIPFFMLLGLLSMFVTPIYYAFYIQKLLWLKQIDGIYILFVILLPMLMVMWWIFCCVAGAAILVHVFAMDFGYDSRKSTQQRYLHSQRNYNRK